ncbi:hypothetical protein Tco_1444442, partial [Tanacetum coccineum]
SPSELPEKSCSLSTSAKLARAKLDKYSGDAGMSKDMLGLEQPGELRRSWIRRSKLRRSQADLDTHQC